MQKKISYLIFFIFVFIINKVSANNWFQDTPLRKVYSALLDDNPIQAWQLLQMLLHRPLDNEFNQQWPIIINNLLKATDCGKKLPVKIDNSFATFIRIALIRRQNLQKTRYQFKISFDGVKFPFAVSLTNNNIPLISADITESIDRYGYAEVESKFFSYTHPNGIYFLGLKKGDISWKIPITLTSRQDEEWIFLLNTRNNQPHINYKIPDQMKGCPPSQVKQQVFDDQYKLIWKSIFLKKQALDWKNDIPNASYANLAVSKRFYQGEILIEKIHTFTFPFELTKD